MQSYPSLTPQEQVELDRVERARERAEKAAKAKSKNDISYSSGNRKQRRTERALARRGQYKKSA